MQPVLAALKDIPGVLGSFMLSPQGALVAREMPSIYPDSTFPELGRRLASVAEALETQMSAVQDLVLKFEDHWLFARRSAHGFLAILTSATVNFPALKMASNVAMKQITEQLTAQLQSLPAETPATVAIEASVVAAVPPPMPEPVAAPVSVPSKPRRMWRGQIVE